MRILWNLGKHTCLGQMTLKNRTPKVKVGGSFSSNAEVLSGIPQGSILGPILFTIFINDLPETVISTCKNLADDTKLYNYPGLQHGVQGDINCLVGWSSTCPSWNLYFNVTKCKVLHISNQNRKMITL